MKGKFSLLVVVCLFLIPIAQAQNNLRVSEAESKAILASNQLMFGRLSFSNSTIIFPTADL